MNPDQLLCGTREKLLRLQYKTDNVVAMISAICGRLAHFDDSATAAKSLEKGFCSHANWRFSTEQFERFLQHIDPLSSLLYRDAEEDSIYEPLEADEKVDLTSEDIAEFEAERREYLKETLLKARTSYWILETALAFTPLFGAHYHVSKRPKGIESDEPARRPVLVFTPQGGQPGFHRKRRPR